MSIPSWFQHRPDCRQIKSDVILLYMQPLDFLAIGDTVIDAFIRLKEAEVKKCVNHERQELCLSFGDKVPFESVEELPAVGNSANAAVAAARLGVSSGLLAHVGKDYYGQKCIDSLKSDNVDTSFIGVHDGLPTNYHYVLWYDVERTILIKHTQFPYALPAGMPAPKMIYLSSLGENSVQFHHDVAAFVIQHPETKLVFQPGTFQIKLGTTELKDIYLHTYAFFCNVEEAQRILGNDSRDIKTLIAGIHALGPKLVFITDGIDGAYASDGAAVWFMPVYPHEPFERTGAGDAFSSTVAVALLLGLPLQEALTWGPANSMSVTQFVGAQKGLLTKEKLQELLTQAPATYQPTLL
jgi:ribokinase